MVGGVGLSIVVYWRWLDGELFKRRGMMVRSCAIPERLKIDEKQEKEGRTEKKELSSS